MSGTVSSKVYPAVSFGAIQPISYGVIIGSLPIIIFPFIPGIVSLKFYGKNICIDTLFGSVSLNNLPEIVVAANDSRSPILVLGCDAFDRPIYKHCLHFDSNRDDSFEFDIDESAEVLIERILNQQPVTFMCPNEVSPSTLTLFIDRLISIRNNLKLQSVKIPLKEVDLSISNGYRNVVSNIFLDEQFLSKSVHFNLDKLATFSLLRVCAESHYEKIFERSLLSGRAIITSSCLMYSPMPIKLSLAANSVFINSFVDVHAILVFSHFLGVQSAISLAREIIKLRARKNDFGYFSLDRHSRDSKDALYFLLDYLAVNVDEAYKNSLNGSDDYFEHSLSLSVSGLFEWMCRSGIDSSLARSRTNYIQDVICSIDGSHNNSLR